jgi:hypothetical protein
MPLIRPISSQSVIRVYYLATFVFLLFDVILNINVRVAFFETSPALRASYYAALFTCMALVLWRPGWTVVIGAIESLVVLVALILGMGMRTMVVSDAMLEGAAGVVTLPEIINFMITGGIAYLAFRRGIHQIRGL